jgi:hypothetical protein
MMTELDTLLMRLASAPVPAALASMDARVFSGVTATRTRRMARGVGFATVGAALVMGVASVAMPVREADPSTLASLGSIPPLSPAALLGVTQ